MAAEKKKTETTAKAEKKPAVKKAAVVKQPAKTKKSDSAPLVIQVPQGGQVIGEFTLTPKKPGKKAESWRLVNNATGEEVKGLAIGFSDESSDLQRAYERAVLVINMADTDKTGTWRFVLNGIVTGENTSDVNHDVYIETEQQGARLIAYVHAEQPGKETIDYGYLASFTDKKTGVVSIYESKDPGVIIGRPFP